MNMQITTQLIMMYNLLQSWWKLLSRELEIVQI